MRRVFIVSLCALVLLSLVSNALAEPKPTHVPHQVIPGEAGWPAVWGTIDAMWADMTGASELPSGSYDSENDGYAAGDEGIRGPVPIGFTFHFMDGPMEPVSGWPPADWRDWWAGATAPPLPEDWPAELSDKGYDQIWVSPNGYLVPADPQYLARACGQLILQDPNIGTESHWWDMAVGPQRPNDYIAAFTSDWIIGDNTRRKVTKVCLEDAACESVAPEAVAGSACHEWVPCEWEDVPRPRGKLLFKTFGDAPNRVFVVEWQNIRNYDSGDLISFQAQLFEGSNAILFQYKDPNPGDNSRPFFGPGGVIGLEDAFGRTFVGQWFASGIQHKPALNWTVGPSPVEDGDQIGFVY